MAKKKKAALKQLRISFKGLCLVSVIVRYGQSFSAFCSSLGKNGSTAGSGHSFSETVFVSFFSVGWLKCTFHGTYFLILFFRTLDCKSRYFFNSAKENRSFFRT